MKSVSRNNFKINQCTENPRQDITNNILRFNAELLPFWYHKGMLKYLAPMSTDKVKK